MTLHMTSEMIPSRRMYASAHNLPLEIVMHIGTLLGGFTINRGGSYRRSSLQLSKMEAGNCSLVCKYWAKTVRAQIFEELLLKTPEDGHQFQSFIERPVSQKLSIQRLVKYIQIECNLADPPWLHCVFMFSRAVDLSDVLVFNSSDTPSDAPSPRLRSIYQSIPRPPPPRMTVIDTLCDARKLAVTELGRSYGDLPSSRALRSGGVESWPRIPAADAFGVRDKELVRVLRRRVERTRNRDWRTESRYSSSRRLLAQTTKYEVKES